MSVLRALGAAALLCIAVVACAKTHRVLLADGTVLYAKGAPKLQPGSNVYHFEDTNGRKIQVNRDQVRSIRELQ